MTDSDKTLLLRDLNHTCFVDAFEESVVGLGIPKSFVRWTAISLIGTALGRKVWSVNRRGKVYPNLFIMMIAPPGVGKSEASRIGRRFLRDINVAIAPSHISKASLIDELAENKTEYLLNGTLRHFSALTIMAHEFNLTFEERNSHLMATLADLWDCPPILSERKRSRNKGAREETTNTCTNILAGIQPVIMHEMFPASAWGGGILARFIFVYTPIAERILLRDREATGQFGLLEAQYTTLVQDFSKIAKLSGSFKEEASFEDAYMEWAIDRGEKPRPQHPRLENYNVRRPHQMEKLSMIAAASRGSMTLTAADHAKALGWLEDDEVNMDDIFLAMNISDDAAVVSDLVSYLWRQAGGDFVPYTDVYRYLWTKVPSERIEPVLDAAIEAEMILRKDNPKGYKPNAKLSNLG